MTPKNEWSPAQGPEAAPEQVPATQPRISGAGDDGRDQGTQELWAPSHGPTPSEPGGPGGEPSGHAVPLPKPDDEP
jgi:hypothetical protein